MKQLKTMRAMLFVVCSSDIERAFHLKAYKESPLIVPIIIPRPREKRGLIIKAFSCPYEANIV